MFVADWLLLSAMHRDNGALMHPAVSWCCNIHSWVEGKMYLWEYDPL